MLVRKFQKVYCQSFIFEYYRKDKREFYGQTTGMNRSARDINEELTFWGDCTFHWEEQTVMDIKSARIIH